MNIGKITDGYRGIRPGLAYDGRQHPLNREQQQWVPEVGTIETAWFSGQRMTVFRDTEGCYALHYLGLTDGMHFRTMAQAKEAAPDFARAVLLSLLAEVGEGDEEPALQDSPRSFGTDDISSVFHDTRR